MKSFEILQELAECDTKTQSEQVQKKKKKTKTNVWSKNVKETKSKITFMICDSILSYICIYILFLSMKYFNVI